MNSLLHHDHFEVHELECETRKITDEDELLEIDREIRESIVRRESMLDSFCDDFTENLSEKRKNCSNSNNKKLIDPKKKKNLLDALKKIDGNDSFDK